MIAEYIHRMTTILNSLESYKSDSQEIPSQIELINSQDLYDTNILQKLFISTLMNEMMATLIDGIHDKYTQKVGQRLGFMLGFIFLIFILFLVLWRPYLLNLKHNVNS